MNLKKAVVSLLFISPFGVNACDLFDKQLYPQQGVDSVVLTSNSGVCLSMDDTLEYATRPWFAIMQWLGDEPSTSESYWDDWVLKSESDPLLTQSIASNYFGFGVWMPPELEDKINDMSTEEWLMSHGLQLSVGFGDKKSGQPRMRFDYRWHDKYEGDVMMQVEVPF
ncbi:hypothetical protein L4D20_20510 [Vibrio kyushuensis]|uniref:hypothetical protein n=1 Tax=Vibrio kyushuensis TaxID=2910249 RepID=UPI003D11037B